MTAEPQEALLSTNSDKYSDRTCTQVSQGNLMSVNSVYWKLITNQSKHNSLLMEHNITQPRA